MYLVSSLNDTKVLLFFRSWAIYRVIYIVAFCTYSLSTLMKSLSIRDSRTKRISNNCNFLQRRSFALQRDSNSNCFILHSYSPAVSLYK